MRWVFIAPPFFSADPAISLDDRHALRPLLDRFPLLPESQTRNSISLAARPNSAGGSRPTAAARALQSPLGQRARESDEVHGRLWMRSAEIRLSRLLAERAETDLGERIREPLCDGIPDEGRSKHAR